ncbi:MULTISPECIES: hypothetical protein [unclassified Brenneria]|uniref:hypothetical protein n=1 Tax=unclassified Brenneria TaxID=2634434 RepID=UPI001555D8F6|nr:hypothetical protein [Brenneria sp. hezel4-2-4]MEE3650114.1 hypothetical protein [Brenneria sp. HEZEL_4_2_4]NPD00073.1 hypothetical protein [Brenneria sp. hezel4-2-4]
MDSQPELVAHFPISNTGLKKWTALLSVKKIIFRFCAAAKMGTTENFTEPMAEMRHVNNTMVQRNFGNVAGRLANNTLRRQSVFRECSLAWYVGGRAS